MESRLFLVLLVTVSLEGTIFAFIKHLHNFCIWALNFNALGSQRGILNDSGGLTLLCLISSLEWPGMDSDFQTWYTQHLNVNYPHKKDFVKSKAKSSSADKSSSCGNYAKKQLCKIFAGLIFEIAGK